eukprot:3475111-Rhodomonas_salina.1
MLHSTSRAAPCAPPRLGHAHTSLLAATAAPTDAPLTDSRLSVAGCPAHSAHSLEIAPRATREIASETACCSSVSEAAGKRGGNEGQAKSSSPSRRQTVSAIPKVESARSAKVVSGGVQRSSKSTAPVNATRTQTARFAATSEGSYTPKSNPRTRIPGTNWTEIGKGGGRDLGSAAAGPELQVRFVAQRWRLGAFASARNRRCA